MVVPLQAGSPEQDRQDPLPEPNDALRSRDDPARIKAMAGWLVAAAAGVWQWDADSGGFTWDERMPGTLGSGAAEAASLEAAGSGIHPDDRARVLALLEGLRQPSGSDDVQLEFRVVQPAGKPIWIHAIGQAERDRDGRLTRVAGLGFDIGARRESAARALAVEQRLQRFVAASRDILYSISADGRSLEFIASRAVEKVYGRPSQAFFDNPGLPLEMVHADDQARIGRCFEALFTTGSFDETYRIVRPDGGVRWLHDRARAVHDDAGTLLRFDGTARDVTALQVAGEEVERAHQALRSRALALERQAVQLRRLAIEVTLAERRTREEVAKTLHEGLQQVLVSATIKLELAMQSGTVDPLVVQAREEVREAIAAARSLSRDLHPPALVSGALPAALRWLGEWMQEKYALQVRVAAQPDADPADAEVRTLLFESVRELLFNAVKHARVDHASVELAVTDGLLAIVVSDQGVGFEPATALPGTWDYRGGLGLRSIRERLNLLGGQFHIDSAPGRGARFELVVPCGPIRAEAEA